MKVKAKGPVPYGGNCMTTASYFAVGFLVKIWDAAQAAEFCSSDAVGAANLAVVAATNLQAVKTAGQE